MFSHNKQMKLIFIIILFFGCALTGHPTHIGYYHTMNECFVDEGITPKNIISVDRVRTPDGFILKVKFYNE